MKKKKVIIPIIVCLLIAAAAVFFIFFFKNKGGLVSKDKLVYVESVRSITGVSLGASSRFMGIVESQETKAVQKDSSKKVKEIFVKEGDYVKEGDDLFSYDTTDMELTLEQLNLERTGIANTLDGLYTSLNEYTSARDSASDEDDKLSYTSNITSTNSQIKEEEYNLSAKDLEIKKQQESIDNCVVKSPMTGVVKKIASNATGGSDDDESYGPSADYSSGGQDDGFITIIAEGNYRIKGITDEMNIYSFTSGTNVILRSRVDESTIWKGSVAKVDMEPNKKSSDDDYYGYGGESASNYNFYVNPENTDGMMLGQHLFIELDLGQGENKEGLHLASYYIMKEESGYYVWKRAEDGTIVKTLITVGEYDEEQDSYEVTAGLSLDDYIAYPDDGIVDGCKTTTHYEDVADQEEELDEDSDVIDEDFDSSMTPGDADDMSDDGVLFDDKIDDSIENDSDDPNEGLDDGLSGTGSSDGPGSDAE